jgi:hypothetical protein
MCVAAVVGFLRGRFRVGVAAVALLSAIALVASFPATSEAQWGAEANADDGCYISERSPNTGLCQSIGYKVGNDGSGRYRALLFFDLSDPFLDEWELATAQLAQSCPPVGLAVHRVTRPWTGLFTGGASAWATWNRASGSSAWLSPGGDFEPTAAATATVSNPTFRLSELVRSWINGSLPNYGLLIKASDEGAIRVVGCDSPAANETAPVLLLHFVPSIAPDVEIGGDLRASAHGPLTGDTYDLWVDAEDGSSSTAPQSGIRSIEVLADGRRVAFAQQQCPQGSCDLDLDWDFLRENFTVGRHVIDVAVRDWHGNVRRETFNVDLSAERTPDPPDDESASQSATVAPFAGRPSHGTGPACSSVAENLVEQPVLNLTHRSAALGGGETTVRYTNGEYLVVHCAPGGRLTEAQHVGPVETPEGIRMLILSQTVPTRTIRGQYLTHYPLYGDPADPRIVSAWRRWRSEVLARVLPPTVPNLLTP